MQILVNPSDEKAIKWLKENHNLKKVESHFSGFDSYQSEDDGHTIPILVTSTMDALDTVERPVSHKQFYEQYKYKDNYNIEKVIGDIVRGQVKLMALEDDTQETLMAFNEAIKSESQAAVLKYWKEYNKRDIKVTEESLSNQHHVKQMIKILYSDYTQNNFHIYNLAFNGRFFDYKEVNQLFPYISHYGRLPKYTRLKKKRPSDEHPDLTEVSYDDCEFGSWHSTNPGGNMWVVKGAPRVMKLLHLLPMFLEKLGIEFEMGGQTIKGNSLSEPVDQSPNKDVTLEPVPMPEPIEETTAVTETQGAVTADFFKKD